jgi:isoleucyl-tRNA synthetase
LLKHLWCEQPIVRKGGGFFSFTVAGLLAAAGIAGPTDAAHREQLFVAIWTTTPWTLPANLAVSVNGQLDYAICRDGTTNGGTPR